MAPGSQPGTERSSGGQVSRRYGSVQRLVGRTEAPCGLTTGGTTVCDTLETGYGSNGRNIFRAPFQTRFDLSLFKNFKVTERVALKFQADAFNIFNHPNFDAPNGNFALNACFNPFPCFPDTTQILSSSSPNPKNFGVIRQTVGSNRFLQLALHLTF